MSACAKWGHARSAQRRDGTDARTAERAARGVPVVLRATRSQTAGVGLADRGVPVRGRAVGGFDAAGRRGGPHAADRRCGGWRGSARLASMLASIYFLVSDLGRPERFHHMLRVAKPSSPMSVGTWILVGLRAGRRAGRDRGADAVVAAPDAARPAGAVAGAAGRAVGGGDRARRGVLHRRPVVPDRRSRVARGAPVAAVRVHRVGGGQWRRSGNAARAGRRGRSGPADGCASGARWRWWRRG